MEDLEFIKSVTKEEVLENWKKTEENLEHWQNLWQAGGHTSWEDWRARTHTALFAKNLTWNLYKVPSPLVNVPEWRGGMFNAWNKWFYPVFSEKPPKLKDFIAHPGVHNHWYVREMARSFKGTETTLIAIHSPDGNVYVVEGMHRTCAIALMAHEKVPLNINVYVMVAEWPENEPPKLGHWEQK